MDRLNFVPKAGAHPRFPNKGHGDMPYVGRVYDPSSGKWPPYPATETPASVKSGTDEAARLIRICKQDGDVLPADHETAKAIGVSFVPITYDAASKEWVLASTKPAGEVKRSVAARKADD